jgi:hypothetical protein
MGDPAKEVTEEMSAIHARLAAKRALLSPEEVPYYISNAYCLS